VLIAYNVNVTGLSFVQAKSIAATIRSVDVRSLAFGLDTALQISCNLVDPLSISIDEIYDQIATLVRAAGGEVREAELVGLIPESLLRSIDEARWAELGLQIESTIESKLTPNGDR